MYRIRWIDGGGVYVASICIVRNPDTLLPHLYSCLSIRYTTIPYQKSAQPLWIPRKVILVMLPPWHLSVSLSLSLIPSLSYCILCSISSLERERMEGEVSPVYWEFLWHVIWHETKITFLLGIISRTHFECVYKVAVSLASTVSYHVWILTTERQYNTINRRRSAGNYTCYSVQKLKKKKTYTSAFQN